MLTNTGRIFKKKAFNSDANLYVSEMNTLAVSKSSQEPREVKKMANQSNIAVDNSIYMKNQLVSSLQTKSYQVDSKNVNDQGKRQPSNEHSQVSSDFETECTYNDCSTQS